MKKCPYCAEEIQDEAIKCKHCHEFLEGSRQPVATHVPNAYAPLPQPAEVLPWYLRTSFIVMMLLMLPPMALPSVWLHPRLHWAWKLVITLAVAGFCWLFYFAVKGLMDYVNELMKMAKEMGPGGLSL